MPHNPTRQKHYPVGFDEGSIRRVRNRIAPYISKYGALKIINPVRQLCCSSHAVRARLQEAMEKLQIPYLDLGGMGAVENYLTIHLSPVELYGKVLTPDTAISLVYENERVRRQDRKLESPAIVLNYDVTNGIPLPDNSLSGINMSHFLEHFPLASGLRLFEECRRVLVPGGIVRVSCPDLRRYAEAYVAGDAEFFRRVGTKTYCNYDFLSTPGEQFISKAYDNANGHLWFYDAETVIYRLKSAGFSVAGERSVQVSNLPGIEHIEPEYRSLESFYVEATL